MQHPKRWPWKYRQALYTLTVSVVGLIAIGLGLPLVAANLPERATYVVGVVIGIAACLLMFEAAEQLNVP